MADTMITYISQNSAPESQWLGFICPNGKRLGITFFGPTEETVKEKMREFWAKDKEVREANRKRIQEQRDRAEARAAAKKGMAEASPDAE